MDPPTLRMTVPPAFNRSAAANRTRSDAVKRAQNYEKTSHDILSMSVRNPALLLTCGEMYISAHKTYVSTQQKETVYTLTS
jgi:hypothetical protein